MRKTILAAACLAALSAPALAINFGTPPVVTTGLNNQMAIGDVNGDQIDDLVADDAILLQKADGSLAAPLHFPYAHNFSYTRTLVDLNHDGTLDVVNCSDNGVQLLSANGSSTFNEVKVAITATTAGATWTCRAVASLDLNHDGNADLVALSGNSELVFLYGDGKGRISSTARQALPPKDYEAMAVGDVTGDGTPDVVLAGEALDVYPGTSSGGLGAVRTSARYANLQQSVAIGDLNGDRRNDVVVSELANWPNSIVAEYVQASNGTLPYNPQVSATQDLPRKTLVADLNHDGVNLVLVAHDSAFGIGMYLTGTVPLGGEVPVAGAPMDYPQSSYELAVGDLNDDGCSDVVGSDYTRRYVFFGGGCFQHEVTSDFDYDGKSDLVWRNAQTGGNVIWRAADSTRPQAVATVAAQAWQIAGTGDFNGDRRADLVWHNGQTGANTVWLSGNAATQRAMTQVTNLDWQIVGIGDFDGDGFDDVLWRNRTTGANAIWKSALLSTPMAVATLADVHWKVAGVGDFDHDYRADILWRNDATGANMYWPAGNAAASHALTGVTNQAWTVAGVGDFDGDGYADIFWRNVSSGANTIWRAADAAHLMPMTTATGNWNVVVGDYNGDGKSDLLWRNPASGVDVLWRAGQSTVQLPVTDVAGTAWTIVR